LHYTLATMDRWRAREGNLEGFRRAAELAPQSPTPLVGLANAVPHGRQGDPEVAIDALRRAVDLADGDAAYARMQLASWLERAGKVDEAMAQYRLLAAQGAPLSDRAVIGLATALARKGDYEQAYRLAAELPVAYLAAGMGGEGLVEWATESGQLDDLRARVERALAQDPQSLQGRLALVRVLQAQGHTAAAIEALRAVSLPAGVLHWGQYSEVVTLAEELGDREFAAQVRRAAIREQLQSGHPGPMYGLMREPRSKEALDELIGEAAALWADVPGAQTRAALLKSIRDVARWMDGMGQEGEAPLPDPQRLSAAECAIWGVIQAERAGHGFRPEEQKIRQNASACLQRALDKWPQAAGLWAVLGELRWSAKAWETSAQAYLKAAAAEPGQVEYGARAAFALARCKQYNRALATGRRVIEPWADEWPARAFFASLQMDCAHSRAARDTLTALYDSPEVHQSGRRRTVAQVLARCHERLNEIDQAVAVWKREIAEGSDDYGTGYAYRSLLELCRRHGRRAAAQAAEGLRAAAGDSARGWREIAELYLAVRLWDDAVAAGERFLALTPEASAADRLRGEILVARAYIGKRDYHEARRRLIPMLARATEPAMLREAADALVSVYVLSDEHDKAIATLQDLLLRTQDWELREWIESRLSDLTSEE
jgi:cytochrome c-type biogenesis protein CcmH/NrfG